MAYEVRGGEDLGALIREAHDEYALITPPSEGLVLRQPMPKLVPFSWDDFSKGLPEILAGRHEYEFSVPVYPLRA